MVFILAGIWKIINTFGRTLVEINFINLNGLNACFKKKVFTFISPNRDSVFDYCIVSEDLISNNLNLTVNSHVDSWPMSISFVMKISKNVQLINSYTCTLSYQNYCGIMISKTRPSR